MPSTKIKKSENHQWEIYTVVPITAKRRPSPKGVRGAYVIFFTLSNSQNLFINDIHPATNTDGGSSIYMHAPNIKDKNTPVKLKIDSSLGIIYYLKSNNGQVNSIETDPFIAGNFEDAVSLAYNNVSPFLSHLSYIADTPLAIQKIDATELSTGSQRFICLPTPKNTIYPFGKNITALDERTAQLLAEYREAKNASTHPLYQLFCYFKIIDGYLSVKAERAKSGKPPLKGSEIIQIGIYTGKKFGWFRDKLQKDFRNEFAHFSYDNHKTKISGDNMDNIFSVFKTLPSAHSTARLAIQNLIDAGI